MKRFSAARARRAALLMASTALVLVAPGSLRAAPVELSGLDGSNGVIFNGGSANARAGFAADFIGDFNGDGFDDVIVGAYGVRAGGNSLSGQSYIVFGTDTTPLASPFDLTGLDGNDGFLIDGIDANDRSGFAVSRAGDVNGDGRDDVLIGAFAAARGGQAQAGEAYVVFGTDQTFAAGFNLADLDGNNGFVLGGVNANDRLGRSVAAAGDVNNDGRDDILIGAFAADVGAVEDAGQAHVVFGKATPFAADLSVTALDGNNGFSLNGIAGLDRAGYDVAGGGDVNGDGIDDILIGAYRANVSGRADAGQTYVVFGDSTSPGASFDLSGLDGNNGFAIDGITANDTSGRSVAIAGDINGDGIDDILIGAPFGDPPSRTDGGEAYVLFGSADPAPGTFDLSALDGNNGFLINGGAGGDNLGVSVAAAGDIDGDGIDDLILGAYNADLPGRGAVGQAVIVLGSRDAFDAALDVAGLIEEDGFLINGILGNDNAGRAVAGAGDFNGDGVDDLLIGAPGADPGGNASAGQANLVLGVRTAPLPAGLLGWLFAAALAGLALIRRRPRGPHG